MPNWIATTLRIKGETADLEAVKKFVASDGRAFDFDKIIPMPETFKKYDTTDYPSGERLQLGEHVGYREDSPIVTPELIEEYKVATASRPRCTAQSAGTIGASAIGGRNGTPATRRWPHLPTATSWYTPSTRHGPSPSRS